MTGQRHFGWYALQRVLQGIFVVFVVTTVVFVLIRLAPGDPFTSTFENANITDTMRRQWIADYGLDRPVMTQYVSYLREVAHGNFGWSFSMRRPVLAVLGDALPNTIVLALLATIIGFGTGILVGVFQARRAPGKADSALSVVSMTVAGLPDFWLALLMLLTFAYWVPVFPVGGATDPVMHEYLNLWGRIWDRTMHLVLPVTTLALLIAAVVARHQRAELLRILPEPYVAAARARGLSERRVIYRHALRNAIIPIVTLFGLNLPLIFTGAVFVEKIFAWPGTGWIIINAVSTRDYPLVTAGVVVTAAAVTAGSILADLLRVAVNPRVTLA